MVSLLAFPEFELFLRVANCFAVLSLRGSANFERGILPLLAC